MIRRLESGQHRAAWSLHAIEHTATLVPNGQVLVTAVAVPSKKARNYTIRRLGCG